MACENVLIINHPLQNKDGGRAYLIHSYSEEKPNQRLQKLNFLSFLRVPSALPTVFVASSLPLFLALVLTFTIEGDLLMGIDVLVLLGDPVMDPSSGVDETDTFPSVDVDDKGRSIARLKDGACRLVHVLFRELLFSSKWKLSEAFETVDGTCGSVIAIPISSAGKTSADEGCLLKRKDNELRLIGMTGKGTIVELTIGTRPPSNPHSSAGLILVSRCSSCVLDFDDAELALSLHQ